MPVGECAPCGDSPLSYMGNITGILTFFLGAIASVLAIYSLTRGALDEITSLSEELDRTLKQVLVFLEYCVAESGRKQDADVNNPQLSLVASLRSLQTTITDLSTGLSNMKQFNRRARISSPFQFRRRVHWVMTRRYFVDGMARISREKEEVIAAQMILLLK
jgi:hypothetical protein